MSGQTMAQITYNPKTDMPDQSGRVFLVTGGTTGLGASSISFIASKNPAHIFFSGRNQKRANELIAKIQQTHPTAKLTFIEADLSSLSSVRSAATQILASTTRLDVLMCNAGIMATPASLSKDGYEIQFATNHLGHALLIKHLLPLLLSTATQADSDVRIVNLSSVAYKNAPSSGIQFPQLKTPNASYGNVFTPNKWAAYGQSKLANLLYATELSARHSSIATVAVHPGFIKTDLHSNENLVDRLLVRVLSRGNWLDREAGAYCQTWAATAPRSEVKSGAYYEPVGVETGPETRQGRDKALSRELWEWTERELEKWA